MFVEDDVAQNYATLPVSFKDELPQMAEFITRANYGLKYGAFEKPTFWETSSTDKSVSSKRTDEYSTLIFVIYS